MSVERDSQAELGALLRTLRQEREPERSADAEDERAAAFAERIDQTLSQLKDERKRSRAVAWVALSLAAAVPLAWFGTRAWQHPRVSLAISAEPEARSSSLLPTATAVAAPQLPAQTPTRPLVREPKKGSAPALVATSPTSSAEPSGPGPAASVSTLGQENRLFRDAISAAHTGQLEQALAAFEQLLHDYPSSPLSQTALVRKFRLLANAGRKSEAVSEAQRYLSAYPTGFAQREAEAVARGQAPDSDAASDEPGSP
jgi:TolA-binding protein